VEQTPARGTWIVDTCGVNRRRGDWEASLALVDPDGSVAALAEIVGTAASATVELSVQLVSAGPPPEFVGELARAAVRLAAESGATRMMVPLAPCDRAAHDLVEASGLDWRMLADGESACAEVTVVPVVPPGPGHGRTRS
jgi:hypothetical protein